VALLTAGSPPWRAFDLPRRGRTLILTTDPAEAPYYSLLALDAEGKYLDVESLGHGSDDHNQVRDAFFLTDELRFRAEAALDRRDRGGAGDGAAGRRETCPGTY